MVLDFMGNILRNNILCYLFLSAIDVIEPEDAFVLTICIVVFPLGIFVLICAFFIKFHIFLYKHKDSIRKFLGIK